MNARDIFNAALERGDPAERAKYLDGACGADATLRNRVEELLAAHQRMGSFLESSPYTLQFDAAPNLALASLLEPGGQIGPYKLLQQIGEGGMGVVFLAEQKSPVKRRVALKVIKPGMDTRQVIARFEAERQALALMDHPNIAQVFDAATTPEGLHYFVMEFVKGVPINEYCDQQQASLRERLQLLQSVCNAVQHAHGKGIIHRDLKPNNILVSPHDGVPVVKVIDFGVAKAIGQQLTDKTVFTQVAQLIGTPLYMSPEQAELNALDVDIRTDVYSLGVVLYELLTGTTPIDNERLKRAAFDEMRRIIREEEPPRPSMRISSLGERLSLISKQRQIDVARLPGLLRGDLDWIVMKALEKDRKRRYETASAFAADIGRYLGELPIEARPPSARYRLQKFVRRNRGVVVSAALLLLSILAGLATSITWAVRAQQAEDKQRATSERLKGALDDAVEQRRIAQRETNSARAARENTRDAFYAASMNLVQNAYDRGDLRRADDILSQHIPKPSERDLRGFEWWYWRSLFHPPYEVLGPEEPMTSSGERPGMTLITPGGDLIVTVSTAHAHGQPAAPEASEIHVWSVAEQRYVWRHEQRPAVTGAIQSAFDPAGRLLALTWPVYVEHPFSGHPIDEKGCLLVLDLSNRRQLLFHFPGRSARLVVAKRLAHSVPLANRSAAGKKFLQVGRNDLSEGGKYYWASRRHGDLRRVPWEFDPSRQEWAIAAGLIEADDMRPVFREGGGDQRRSVWSLKLPQQCLVIRGFAPEDGSQQTDSRLPGYDEPVAVAAYQERAGYLVAQALDGRLRRYRLRPIQRRRIVRFLTASARTLPASHRHSMLRAKASPGCDARARTTGRLRH